MLESVRSFLPYFPHVNNQHFLLMDTKGGIDARINLAVVHQCQGWGKEALSLRLFFKKSDF